MTDFHAPKEQDTAARTVWEDIKARGPELYAEFCRNPIGAHSPDLQFILQHFRKVPVKGKYVLVARIPHEEWVLGRLSGVRGEPVEIDNSAVFHNLEEAERHVFRLRWMTLTGDDLGAAPGGSN